MRAVDEELQKLRSSNSPRADMVAIHMNRVILHLIFQDPEVRRCHHDNAVESDLIPAARKVSEPMFAKVADYLEAQHPTDYLASLCKNISKCEELTNSYLRPRSAPAQGGLFD
jgi:hypothetical protein